MLLRNLLSVLCVYPYAGGEKRFGCKALLQIDTRGRTGIDRKVGCIVSMSEDDISLR